MESKVTVTEDEPTVKSFCSSGPVNDTTYVHTFRSVLPEARFIECETTPEESV